MLLIYVLTKQKKLLTSVVAKSKIDLAYLDAINFTKSHYENFPVLSFLVPKKLQKHVAVIYKFARQADDMADEGEHASDKRLDLLHNYERAFNNSLDGNFKNPFWEAFANTLKTQKLTSTNFSSLLVAFKQDVTQTRYSTHSEVLNYCKHSANPVGRIILELHNVRSEEAMTYSDKICTALQLTNFLQDIAVDIDKGRIYIPLDVIKKYGVSETTFYSKRINSNFIKLMEAEVELVSNYFTEGKNLFPLLPLRLRQQIKWTVNGGNGILGKIKNLDYDVLSSRPKFSKSDLIKLLFNIQIR